MQPKFLATGDPAPWFAARSPANPRFMLHGAAGRYIVLCFFGTAADDSVRQMLESVRQRRDVFDDKNASFFGVSIDPADEQLARIREDLPGFHLFWDFDRNISRLYKAVDPSTSSQAMNVPYRQFSVVLDERLRVFSTLAMDGDAMAHATRLIECLSQLPALPESQPATSLAPILVVPRVFEPSLCRELIDYYDKRGGVESGFVREVDGRTIEVHDYSHKRRRDQEIEDEELRKACMIRIHNRLAPEILRSYQFRATRMERYLVACYDSGTGGYFRPHRDNTTKGTAHRRFAVSLNLNTDEYEGGSLRFPEFGRQTYAAPAGGAVVFSCSLLHEATPVTSGRRYAFLPFLYDDAAARIREENARFIGAGPAQGSANQAAP